MSATTVFLVRHAAHDRLDRVLAGRMPGIHLGETGRRQAGLAAERLARERIAAVYSSPMERARETAEPIAERLGLPIAIAPEMTEIDFGDWTGASFDELAPDERWQSWNRERAAGCPPAGEPMNAVQDRAASSLERWRVAHPDSAVVAVSHADVIRALICRVLGLSLDRYHAFEISPASITTLVAWQGGGKVICMNEPTALAMAA